MTTKAAILIADDHEVNRRLLDRILSPHGFLTLHASNGKEAVDAALAHAPAVILMDIRMPIMDGLEALLALRQYERTRHIPVIAITAFATHDQLKPIADAGFDAVVTKPIDVEGLLGLVRRHIPGLPA